MKSYPTSSTTVCGTPHSTWRDITPVARIKNAASTKFEVLSGNQVTGNQGLRPDLVLKKGPNISVVDVTVTFDNRLAAFEAAAVEK